MTGQAAFDDVIGLPQIVVLLMVVQRVAELVLAKRNTRRLMARGAHEEGARHYPLFIALHTAWLASVFLLVSPGSKILWPLLAALAALQLARLWVIVSLGPYWTTRVITLPGAPLVRRGPYRFMKHPNYAVVVLEIALLPLAFGAWGIAAVFSALNAVLLLYRISVEERAIRDRASA